MLADGRVAVVIASFAATGPLATSSKEREELAAKAAYEDLYDYLSLDNGLLQIRNNPAGQVG